MGLFVVVFVFTTFTESAMLSEQLDRIKAKRGGHRGIITKLPKKVAQLFTEESERAYKRLRSIDHQLEEKVALLQNLDGEILELVAVDEIEEEIIEADVILEKITQLREQVAEFFAKSSMSNATNKLPLDGVVNRTLCSRESSISSVRSRTSDVSLSWKTKLVTIGKLPKLHINKFSGDVTKFRSFWKRFDSAVNKNPTLSAIDKLECPAVSAIQGLALSEGNYAAALELLQQHFGRTQQVISAHMEELLKLPCCNGDRLAQLRAVYDKISVNVRGLEAIRVTADQYRSFLIPVIMGKLPSDVRLQIAKATTREEWDVEELLQVIKQEVEAREISEDMKIHKTKNIDSNKRNFTPTASALVVRDGHFSGNKKCCVYCKGDHYSASCERVNSSVNCREVLMKEGCCFLCLSSGHRANQCNSTQRCRKCSRRHHQSICEQGTTQHVGSEDTQDTAPKTTVAIGKSKSNMLLQTACIFTYSVDEELIPVRVLMDNGSQRSYVTNSLSARLGLRPLK